MNGKSKVRLGTLKRGTQARISGIQLQGFSSEWRTRLLEMGFLEGESVQVVHESPFGGDPIAVRIRGSMIALRRSEANAIEVVIE